MIYVLSGDLRVTCLTRNDTVQSLPQKILSVAVMVMMTMKIKKKKKKINDSSSIGMEWSG